MKICRVYGLFSTQEPKHIRYVGQTIRSVDRRMKVHVYEAKKQKKRRPVLDWIRSVEKRGFEIGVVELNKKAKWNTSEEYYIAKLRKDGNKLLNLTDGGEGTLGWKPSQKWRKNVSKRNTGIIWSEESKKNRREYLKSNHPMKGKKHSLATRRKMSIAKKGKVLPHMLLSPTEEAKKKIGKASRERLKNYNPLRGRKLSVKTRKKISESLTGKKHSEETRRKMSASRKGRPSWNKGLKYSYGDNGVVIQ